MWRRRKICRGEGWKGKETVLCTRLRNKERLRELEDKIIIDTCIQYTSRQEQSEIVGGETKRE